MASPAETTAGPSAPPFWERWLRSGSGRWLGIAVALVFTAALLLPDPGPLSALRLNSLDRYQVWMPRKRESHPAIIITVDDASLLRIGQWPWPRDLLARLVDRITEYEPAALGIDILFTEPDRSSPERMAEAVRQRDPVVAEHLSKMQPNDAIFAAAIRRARAVIGVAGIDQQVERGAGTPPAVVVGATVPLDRYPGALRSLPNIDRAASGHGLINADPERGIVRRVPLAAYAGGEPVLTLALECIRVAAGIPSFVLTQGNGVSVEIGDLEAHGDRSGKAWVHFSPHDGTRFVSAADVLDGKVNPERIKNKIVLLGVTALALLDQHTTARGEQLPGIEIHAQLVENIFDGTLLTRASWSRHVEAFVFLLAAAMLIVVVPKVRPRRSFATLLACWLVFVVAGVLAYGFGRMLFDPITPAVGLTVLYGFMVSATLVKTEVNRRDLSARLTHEREEAARVSGELEAARRIQMGMLPTRESALRDERRVEIFAHMSAARHVGGDLYDFFRLAQDRFIVMVGDVSGKGLPAAMFMAVSKALAKSSALRSAAGAAELVTRFNAEISRENPEQMFVTLVLLVVDLSTGEVEYCNAGHEPPLLMRRSGEALVLDEGGGPPLCVIEDFEYEAARAQLQPRDLLVMASDGLTEAMNREGALYGRVRLKALLEAPGRRGLDPSVIGNDILTAIKAFEAGAEPSDDQTLVLFSWRGAF